MPWGYLRSTGESSCRSPFSELGDYISGRLMEFAWRDMILWWAQTKLKIWASTEITLFSMLSNTSSLPLYSWLPTSLKQQIQNYPIQSYPAVTVADLFFPYNEDVMKRTDICHRSLLLYTLGFIHCIISWVIWKIVFLLLGWLYLIPLQTGQLSFQIMITAQVYGCI